MDTTYDIEIDYQTGDSMQSYRETRRLGFKWKSREKAREALARIGEHYRWYQRYQKSYSGNDRPTWHANFRDDDGRPLYEASIVLEIDDGTPVMISAFWCGYFETLRTASIVSARDSADFLDFNEEN